MAKYDISKKATSENPVCRCAPMLRVLVVHVVVQSMDHYVRKGG